MNDNIHAIIFKPFQDISGITSFWSETCEMFAVAQHPAEGKTKRIHCHILIINPSKKRNAYNEDLHKFFPGINGKSDFRLCIKTQDTKEPIRLKPGLRYILKGDISRLRFSKNISKELLDEAIASWVNLPTEIKPKSERTDWDIINDMKKDLFELKIIKPRLFTQDDNRYSTDYIISTSQRSDFIKVINKHLRLNKKKTSIHDIERWIVTLMREDYNQPFWDKLFSKLDI